MKEKGQGFPDTRHRQRERLFDERHVCVQSRKRSIGASLGSKVKKNGSE